MKNARVTVDGTKCSMAALIAAAAPKIAEQKDATFLINPDLFLDIDNGFCEMYPKTKELRHKIAKRSGCNYVGIWNGIKIFYSIP